jgi:transposase
MSSSPFLPLPTGLEITAVETVDDLLVVQVVSSRSCSHCPLCLRPARRVHSRYTRVVADLPCAGERVQLRLQMRKFFCESADCSRKITTRADSGFH